MTGKRKMIIAFSWILCFTISCTFRDGAENSIGKMEAITVCSYTPAASSYQQEYVSIMEIMHGEMSKVEFVRNDRINFLKQMIPHHQGAIDMAEAIIKCTNDKRVINIAKGIIVEQRNEIAIMEGLIKELETQKDLNKENR